MNGNLKALYDAASKDYDLGSFDEFAGRMRLPENRKAFYQSVSQDYDLGDFQSFEGKVAERTPYSPPKVTTAIPPEQPGAFESGTSGLLKGLMSVPVSAYTAFDPKGGVRAQQNIEAALPSPGVSGFVGQSIGSIAPTALAMAIPPLALPVLGGYAAAGVGQGRGVVEELRQEGIPVSGLEELMASAGFAASEFIPEAKAFQSLAKLAIKKYGTEVGAQIAKPLLKGDLKMAAKMIAKATGIEATQEAVTQIGQSGIETGLDPNKDFLSAETAKEVGLAAAGGAIGGAALGGGISLANRYGRTPPQSTQPPSTPQDVVEPPVAPQVPLQPESVMSPVDVAIRDALLPQMANVEEQLAQLEETPSRLDQLKALGKQTMPTNEGKKRAFKVKAVAPVVEGSGVPAEARSDEEILANPPPTPKRGELVSKEWIAYDDAKKRKAMRDLEADYKNRNWRDAPRSSWTEKQREENLIDRANSLGVDLIKNDSGYSLKSRKSGKVGRFSDVDAVEDVIESGEKFAKGEQTRSIGLADIEAKTPVPSSPPPVANARQAVTPPAAQSKPVEAKPTHPVQQAPVGDKATPVAKISVTKPLTETKGVTPATGDKTTPVAKEALSTPTSAQNVSPKAKIDDMKTDKAGGEYYISQAQVQATRVDNNRLTGERTIGYKFTKVDGKPVTISGFEDSDLFIHRSDNKAYWIVSEGKTGNQIAKGGTRKEAIDLATSLLNKVGKNAFNESVNKSINDGSKSPRVIEAKPESPPPAIDRKAPSDADEARLDEIKRLGKQFLGIDENLGIVKGMSDADLLKFRKLLFEDAKFRAIMAKDKFIELVNEVARLPKKLVNEMWNEYEASLAKPETKVGTPEKEERAVGLNIAQNKAFAERMGLDALERPEAEAWTQAYSDAIEGNLNDPDYVQNKAEEVLDNPEKVRMSRAEQAGLLEEYVRLEGELDTVLDNLKDLKGNLKDIAEGTRDTLLAKLRLLQEASEQHRTESAWDMQFGRALKKGNQYTSARMLKNLEAATEKPATEEQIEEASKHKKNIADKEKAVAEAEDKDVANKAKIREKRGEQAVERERRLQERIAGRNRKQAEIDAEIETEFKAIEALGIRLNDVTGVTVEGLQHLGKLVALYAEKGGISFTDAADKVLARLVNTKLTRDDLLDAADMMTDKAKDKQKEQGRRMVKALGDGETAAKDAGKADNTNSVKKAIGKLEKAAKSSGYSDARLQKILAKIKQYQDALERGIIIKAKKRAPDPAIIAESKKILSELRQLMRARERAADIRAKIARGDPVARINVFTSHPSATVLKARAELAAARREWDAYVVRHSKIKLTHILHALLNINKPFVWGFDMSVSLVQLGRFASANPIIAGKAIGSGSKAAFSEKYASQRMERIKSNPLYGLEISSGLAIKDPNDPISQPEEMFNNRMAIMVGEYAKKLNKNKPQKALQYTIRAIPEGIKGSDRAFVVPVNEVLHEMFTGIYETSGAEMTDADFKQTANLLNTLVGRGRFGEKIEGIIRGFQALGIMGAPRLFASQIAATPRLIKAIGNRHLRKLAIRQLSTFYGVRVGLLTLLAVASDAFDWEIEFEGIGDPWSANFGQFRLGNTRYDVWGGHRSQARTIAMAILYHWRPKDRETLDLNQLFAEMVTRRQSPFWRMAFGLYTSRDWMNKPTTRGEVLREGFTPITSQDIVDTWGDGVYKTSATGLLAFFGVPGQTYGGLTELTDTKLQKQMKQEVANRKRAGKNRDETARSINATIGRESPLPLDEDKRIKQLKAMPPDKRAVSLKKFRDWERRRAVAKSTLARELNIQYRGTGQ